MTTDRHVGSGGAEPQGRQTTRDRASPSRMKRLIDLGGLAVVIVWTLFSIAGHGVVDAMSSWLATAPLPELMSAAWSTWLAGILGGLGTAIAVIVWLVGLLVILVAIVVLRSLFGRAAH